jgi:hypothetical protein
MTDQPVPIRTDYVGIVDGGHLWSVWRIDTNEQIGWSLTPIETDADAEAEAWAIAQEEQL